MGIINVIFKKIDSYVLSCLEEDVQCDAIAISELCESRDSCDNLTKHYGSSLKHYALHRFRTLMS